MQTDGSFLCFGNTETPKENSIETPSVEVSLRKCLTLNNNVLVKDDLDASFFSGRLSYCNVTGSAHFSERRITS